jgi:DNA-binding response OmpR family regulator
MFERFAQADATNGRQKGGTGLGLSIAKQIVDRLGGQLGFADAPGGGTTFHVALPRWGHAASVAIDRRARPDDLRILLCEGDLNTAVALREQLNRGGFATDFALTAVNALTCAAATQYRAVLVDLQLPGGDGINLILRLRELPRYRDTPIVALSADPGRGRDDLQASRLNVLEWLDKPVDVDRLMAILAKPAVRDVARRPRILHVDSDNVVARSLSEFADVVSVPSIEEAQRALKVGDFALAVLDIAPAAGLSLAPLPDLRDSRGNAIPMVVLSPQGATLAHDMPARAAPRKPNSWIDNLVATVCDRLASHPSRVAKEIA